jgi:alpha-mannosidase
MATEQQVLASVGITNSSLQQQIINGTKRLLILDSTAHLDWDWLLPFPLLLREGQSERAVGYFTPGTTGPAESIFSQASGLIAESPSYHYSICEVGFLRGFAQACPAEFQQLINAASKNANLRFAGGGITSPDNLLPHGEAIIRNYLIGHAWLAANCPGLPVPLTMWVPDDFGHDPELPVLMQAMGFIAAGFERIPGGNFKDPLNPVEGGNSLAQILTKGIIDFQWSASDGSTANAHWLIGGYCQGGGLQGSSDISGYLATNLAPSPTPYIYVPVCCDFLLPNSGLTQIIDNWNESPISPYGSVVAAAGSFEDYAQLIGFHQSALNSSHLVYGPVFNPNPFYTGCYGSRPEIKILHHKAVRNLLAAEAFSLIASWAQPSGGSISLGTGVTEQDRLLEAWNLLVPSTHHDYITGTAMPDVFHSEQIGLLKQAASLSKGILDDALQTIAGSVTPKYVQSPSLFPVVVFNPLGFSRNNEVAYISADHVKNASIKVSGTSYQQAHDGGLLFVASAPALGYQTAYLTSANNPPASPVTVTPPTNPVSATQVTIANGLVSATLQQNSAGIWALASVTDLGTSTQLLNQDLFANELLFYQENGDEYLFGNEVSADSAWNLADVSAYLSNPAIEIVESGPLRGIVKTSFTYNDGTTQIEYVMEYIIHTFEPMLRMRTTGAAPMTQMQPYTGYSVLTSFPLNPAYTIDTLVRGTPYHWTDVMPDWISPEQVYWNGQMFMPTHNFAIAEASGVPLCAVYHADVPAWGISYEWNSASQSFNRNNSTLYGCLWRNGNGNYFNWVSNTDYPLPLGTDPGVHVREYALRIPSGLGAPQSCGPLKESLVYSNPLVCLPIMPWNGALDDTLSLASSSNSSAIITAAKQGSVNPGNLILRVYQPSNGKLQTILTLDPHLTSSSPLTVTGQSALEQNLASAAESALQIGTTSNTVAFTAVTALTTLAVATPQAMGKPPG